MNTFDWIEECQQAFEDLKKFLATPSLLSKLEVREELYPYLVASPEAVSLVLVRLDDKRIQKLIYYTSWVLHDIETRYSKSKKIVYALIISMQHVRPYFQAHLIVVLIEPLRDILQ